jgi:hypothetical protein
MNTKSRLIILLFELDNTTHESYILLGRKQDDGIFKTVCSKGSYVSISNTPNALSDRSIIQVGKHTVMCVYRTASSLQTFELIAMLAEFDELLWVNVNDIVDAALAQETNQSCVTLTNGLKVAQYVAYLLINV